MSTPDNGRKSCEIEFEIELTTEKGRGEKYNVKDTLRL